MNFVNLMKLLRQRAAETFKALLELFEENSNGVTPFMLAEKLVPVDFKILRGLDTLINRHPEPRPGRPVILDRDAARLLANLAQRVEQELRRFGGGLKEQADEILRTFDSRESLMLEDALKLRNSLAALIIGDMQGRVSAVRRGLKNVPPDPEGFVVTITEAPWRIVRALPELKEKDLLAIRALHRLFNRKAWLKAISEVETTAFLHAQDRFRFGIVTGRITTDNRERFGKPGASVSQLSEDVQDQLNRASDHSHRLQHLFNYAYTRCVEVVDPDSTLILARWARPHANEIAWYLDEARNAILRIMNPLFLRAGCRAYPLIRSPHHLDGPRPMDGDEPEPLTEEELLVVYLRLHHIAVQQLLSRAA